MTTPEQQNGPDYYPADLQAKAEKAYGELPECGTVAQLVDQIVAGLPTRKNEDNDGRSFIDADAWVLVGWKNDILTEPPGQETREVINIGTIQWLREGPESVVVCLNHGYISHRSGSPLWLTISDEQAEHYRGLRWEIINNSTTTSPK